jgi:DNA mismatch repair ATPase MutS
MLIHWRQIKAHDPEAIVLFRVEDEEGDLYRAYRDDAPDLEHFALLAVGSVIRHCPGTAGGWCGIEPRHLDAVLARIAAAGKRVAVCERVPPGEAKGEPVERIATPGAIETAHTTGPWEIEEELDAEGEPISYIVGPDGETIAMISDDIMDDEEVRANARLMVVAPDLLAACRKILEDLDGDSILIVSLNAIDLVRAAIRKAEGRS